MNILSLVRAHNVSGHVTQNCLPICTGRKFTEYNQRTKAVLINCPDANLI